MNHNEVTRKKIGQYLITIELDDIDWGDSPRQWSNLGKMVCWHRRYNLGDEQPKCDADDYIRELLYDVPDIEQHPTYLAWAKQVEETWGDELFDICLETWLDDNTTDEDVWKILSEYYIYLPLYLYDHSGITMNTSGFSCPWDSGQVGFIYVSKADARKEYGDKYDENTVRQYLQGEVQTYDAYLRGEVYGYLVYKIPLTLIDGDEDDLNVDDLEWQDSCWGFYPTAGHQYQRSVPAYLDALEEARDYVTHRQKEDGDVQWSKISTTGLEE